MKKRIYSAILISIIACLSSCINDEESRVNVDVTVLDSQEQIKEGITVYMFEEASDQTFGSDPVHATKHVVSNKNGIAHFELLEVYEMDLIANKAQFYFTIFNEDREVIGTKGLSVEKGNDYEISITLSSSVE